ncbi:hypothetical protein Clacol_003484 [Clathrus columnatus]|uniref:Uncharacterized protein n=1 Tax=Clathrus columnatus TaxID=1419009 RepID=A0AAV5A6H1_9AGAM|nr:hypothetical protein Clacol_003484 [Clathrus columnatus]
MPLPDTLPPEIWHKILENGQRFSPYDYRAMLAVAPQTVAKGMHDAAFARLFNYCYFETSKEDDLHELISKLTKYLLPDSMPRRAAIRYLSVRIYTDPSDPNNAQNTDHSGALSKVEDCGLYPVYLVGSELSNSPVICDVLMALPNITELRCRQVSLEILQFGVHNFDFTNETTQHMEEYDVALCSEAFTHMLLLLKNLKFLKLMGYTFFLDHPALRLEPLPKLEILVIQSAYTVPITELLRLKEIAPQIEFASLHGGIIWLQNKDKHEPQKIDYRHPMYRNSSTLFMKYNDAFVRTFVFYAS